MNPFTCPICGSDKKNTFRVGKEFASEHVVSSKSPRTYHQLLAYGATADEAEQALANMRVRHVEGADQNSQQPATDNQ